MKPKLVFAGGLMIACAGLWYENAIVFIVGLAILGSGMLWSLDSDI